MSENLSLEEKQNIKVQNEITLFEGLSMERIEKEQSGWYCCCENGHIHPCHEKHVHEDTCDHIYYEFSWELVWKKFLESNPPSSYSEIMKFEAVLGKQAFFNGLENNFYTSYASVPLLKHGATVLWHIYDTLKEKYGDETTFDHLQEAVLTTGSVAKNAYQIRNMWATEQQRLHGNAVFYSSVEQCTSKKFVLIYKNFPDQPEHD